MKRAQSVVEYALFLMLVASAIVAMQPYLRRGIQSVIKVSSDQLGKQDEGFFDINPKKEFFMINSSDYTSNTSSTQRKRQYTEGKQTADSLGYEKETTSNETSRVKGKYVSQSDDRDILIK